MKKRILPLLLTLALLMSLLPQLTISAGATETVQYIYYEVDADGNEIQKLGTRECEVLTGGSKNWVWGNAKKPETWYIARGNVTFSKRQEVTNAVHLILADGCNVTCERGIRLEEEGDGNSLTIYAQSEGPNTGGLYAKGTTDNSGIGSDEPFMYGTYEDCTADLTIHGGRITAVGGDFAAGIGGGHGVNGGRVTVYNGAINAYAGNSAAAIGGGVYGENILLGSLMSGGGKGGNVTIYGGEVYAFHQQGQAGNGIGSAADEADSGSLNLHGGIIHAEGYQCPVTVATGLVVRSCEHHSWTPYKREADFTTPFGSSYNYNYREGTYPHNRFNNSSWGEWIKSTPLSLSLRIMKPDEPVPYWAYDAETDSYETKTTEGTYTFVKNDTIQWGDGWYIANKTGAYDVPVTVKAGAHARLILQNGITLEAKKGIVLNQGSTLSIYAQLDAMADGSENTGKLVVTGGNRSAAIGTVNGTTAGNLIVHGGRLDLTGGSSAPAISTNGSFTFYGGTLDAKCGAGGTYTINESSILLRRGYEFYDLTEGKLVVRPDGKTWAETFGNGTISVTPAINDAPEPIPYLRWQDDRIGLQTAETTKYLRLELTDTVLGADDCSCYVLRDDLTLPERLTVSGTVDLILKDGWTLTAKKGIYVGEGSTLNIYGQTGGTGKLVARLQRSPAGRAAIGGGDPDNSGGYTCGTVNIHGGTVNVQGSNSSAGIGGGNGGSGGTVNVYGGTVDATGGTSSAGIGGGNGGSGGAVTIKGGTVTAKSGTFGAGIGGGSEGGGGTVTIKGGTVTATADSSGNGAGIGGGYMGGGGSINIEGGTVTATGGNAAAGIGGGSEGGGGTVTIEGGTVNATGGGDGSGIGCGRQGTAGTITVSGGEVVARAGEQFAGEAAPAITRNGFSLRKPEELAAFVGASEETAVFSETIGDAPYVRITGAFAARIGDTYYSTLDEAFAVMKPGDTVELLKRGVLTGDFEVPRGVTIAAGQKGLVAPGRLTGSVTGNVLISSAESHYTDTKGQEYFMPVGERNLYVCDPELKPSSWSLNLDNSLRINVYFPKRDPATHVNADGRLFYDAGDVDRDCHCRLGSLSAKEMTDTCSVAVVQPGSDPRVSPTIEVSVRKYAEERLSKVWWNLDREDIGYKIGRLMVAMLNYGAAAQKYFDNKTEDLANANIDRYQENLPQTPARTDQRRVSGDPELFYGTSCVLGENMNIKFYFQPRDAEIASLTLRYDDYRGMAHEIIADISALEDAGDGYVSYTLETLVAGDIDTKVTVILKTEDGRSVEVEDSISSYLERIKVSNPKCKDIAEKTLQFGYLAKAYFLDLDDPPAPSEDKTPVD